MHKIKPTFWLCSVLILWRICMRSLARAIHTLFQTPPPPPLEPRIAALKVFAGGLPRGSTNYIGPLPFKHRFALKISSSNWVRSCPRLNYRNVSSSTEELSHGCTKRLGIWIKTFSAHKAVWEQKRDWALTAPGDIATIPVWTANRIFSRWSWLQLPAKTSSRLFPRSEELHPPESNLGFSLWFIWRTFQHRGLNRLDEVECAIFQGTFNSNCIGSRIWWTGCGTWNVVSPSRLPKNTVTSLSARQTEKSPFDKVGTVLKTQKSVIITYKLSYIRLFRTALPYLLSIIPLFFKWSHLAGLWILEI